MYHNLGTVNDEQLSREVRRVKGAIVSYGDYLERLLREERLRLFGDRGTIDSHLAEAIGGGDA